MSSVQTALALASYAKQSKDESLRKMADRIQARAIRRCGELLKQIEPASGTRTDLRRTPARGSIEIVAAGTSMTRQEAAEAAGLSDHQRKTALRVANVPRESFERQVESAKPPTVTKLAEQGKKPLVNLGQAKPKDFARSAGLFLSRRAQYASDFLGLLYEKSRSVDICALALGCEA